MPASETLHLRSVVILLTDRLYAEGIRHFVLGLCPDAAINVTTTADMAAAALSGRTVDLFIASSGSLDDDVLALLRPAPVSRRRPKRALVLSAGCDCRLIEAFRSLGIEGVFDSSADAPENFGIALQTVASGRRYWSASILAQLQPAKGAGAIFRVLTPFEQLVLAMIGDGCDDTVAAQELGCSPATVGTVRRDLHRKLNVQHRGELVRIAAQHGFVRFTPAGVVRPGFALLAAACTARKPRRASAPETAAVSTLRRLRPERIEPELAAVA